jgi:hypothetical protein
MNKLFLFYRKGGLNGPPFFAPVFIQNLFFFFYGGGLGWPSRAVLDRIFSSPAEA